MRKFIIGIAAIAMLAIIPASASAAVERCKVTTTVTTPSVTTATFKVFEPAGTKEDFGNVWTTDYEVIVNDDGTFEGTGKINGSDPQGNRAVDVPTTILGTFDRTNNTVTYVAKPVGAADGVEWTTVGNAVTDGNTVNPVDAWHMEGEWVRVWHKVTQPVFVKTPGVPTITTTEYKNHGEYVSSLGGGKAVAQACQGMPVVSTQGKS